MPRAVLSAVLAEPDAEIDRWTRRWPAVAAFVDIAGFTPMSEALAGAGRRGTEELTDLLNGFFRPTIELFQDFGANIAGFGGDALMIVFPHGDEDGGETARRALRSALDLQAGMIGWASVPTSAGTFTLNAKVGLGAGEVVTAAVGDDSRLLPVVAGEAVERCAEAEHHASQGEIVAHRSVLSLLDDRAHEAFEVIRDLRDLAGRNPLGPLPPIDPGLTPLLARFVHPAVADRLLRGTETFIDEHRKVTAVFVNLDLADYRHEATLDSLRRHIAAAVPVVTACGGHLAEVSAGDKGTGYLVLFGAPVAHDDDEARALTCALRLRDLPGPTVKLGAATGPVWCGLLGSRHRRTYTAEGDTVNLAARLMQAASWGDVLTDAATRDAAGSRVATAAPRPLAVKGKAEPVEAAVVQTLVESAAQNLHEPAYTTPLLGRAGEMTWASEALAGVRAGSGRTLGLCGGAGVGKSRLAAAVVGLARHHGMEVHGGAFEAYGERAGYLGWRSIWRTVLGVDGSAGAEELDSRLAAAVAAADHDLVPHTPLLGAVLGVELPDNDFTATLEPELRSQLVRSLLLAFLRHRVGAAPLLLVLEDCHWMDLPSRELLRFLGRNLRSLPVALLLLYRPPAGDSSPLGPLLGASHVEERVLDELAPEATAELVRQRCVDTLGTEPTEAFVDAVRAKAGGNPLFVEGVVGLAAARGIDPSAVTTGTDVGIPDDLASVLMARIDQLGHREQEVLKVASVVGRRFTPDVLTGSHPTLGSPSAVQASVETLSRVDLTPVDPSSAELAYVFKHAAVRDVAYDSLTFRARQRLHEAVGDHLERSAGNDLTGSVEALAHHYGHSTNVAKRRRYLTLAGDTARAAYSNEAAIDYYTKLRPLIADAGLPDLLLKLGALHEHVGRWPEAEACYREAVSTGAVHSQAPAMAALGNLLALTAAFDEALVWLDRAQATAEDLGDERALSGVLAMLGPVHLQRCDYGAALAASRQHLLLARAARDQVQVGRALHTIGVVHLRLGDQAAATDHLHQALELGTATGDELLVVHAANDLAAVHSQQGDIRGGLRWLDEASAVAGRIGHRAAVAVITGNQADLRRLRGDAEGALLSARRSLEIHAEVGSPMDVLVQISIVAMILAAQRSAAAEGLFRRAVTLGRGLERTFYQCEPLIGLAELSLDSGRRDEAADLVQEALALACEVQDDEMRFRAEFLAVRVAAASPEADLARCCADLLTLLGEWTEPAQQAAIHHALWQIDPSSDENRRVAASLYAEGWADAPLAETLQRYEELTGESLGAFEPLPPVADSEDIPSLDELLARLDAIGMGGADPDPARPNTG